VLRRLATALFRPIDIAWLVFFQIGAGWLLALEEAGSLALGYSREYTEPRGFTSRICSRSGCLCRRSRACTRCTF